MADKGQGAKSIKTTRLIKMAEPAVSDLVALVNVDVEIQDGSNKGYQQPVFHFLEKTKKGWKIVNGLVMSSSEKQPCLIREGSFGYLEENQIKLYKEAKGCYAESR
jgi:ketosteroid isomerase-like protein